METNGAAALAQAAVMVGELRSQPDTRPDPDVALAAAKALESARRYADARELLRAGLDRPARPLDSHTRRRLVQRLVRCIYKDPEQAVAGRLDEAWRMLERDGGLDGEPDQETLGLAGAVRKRMFEVTGDRGQLERALGFYRRGAAADPSLEQGQGYTAVNAAFVLDLLAEREEREAGASGVPPVIAQERRREADAIRGKLAAELPGLIERWRARGNVELYWPLATLAEAFVGLGDFARAEPFLREAGAIKGVVSWERESTARQLARLVGLRFGQAALDEEKPARRALGAFLGDAAAGLSGLALGKVGLALSGGGFRASLFHLGVLARLAELDVLRHVEVLSCVSGGSIVGAHYYLELRHRLETQGTLGHEDYIEVVQTVTREFLAGVQTNLRTCIPFGVFALLKMLVSRRYSRSTRLGELYEEVLYSRVADGHSGPRLMSDLKVTPAGEAPEFNPKVDNWRLSSKVPILILNATALNTCHPWQFAATWMGEPPAAINSEVDANPRLRRMYYGEAPGENKKVRLGQAVAASACVSSLFPPVELYGLYPDRVVRLVDGGVYDNQGIASLLEQDCQVMLVSDASGQTEEQLAPNRLAIPVGLRSNNVLMARVRVAEFEHLDARRRAGMLRGLMFIHLKKELEGPPVNWIDCAAPKAPNAAAATTSYGIDREVQHALSELRTDLDSFSNAEAFALMTSGYRMASTFIGDAIPASLLPPARTAAWRFLEIDPAMSGPGGGKTPAGLGRESLLALLRVGTQRAFKVWRLVPALRWLCVAVLAAGGLAAAWLTGLLEVLRHSEPGIGGLAVVPAVALALLSRKVRRAISGPLDQIVRAVGGTAFAVPGTLLVWLLVPLHLSVFDRLFLRRGRV